MFRTLDRGRVLKRHLVTSAHKRPWVFILPWTYSLTYFYIYTVKLQAVNLRHAGLKHTCGRAILHIQTSVCL